MFSAPSETFIYHFMPIPLGGNFYPFTQMSGRNFYQISLRARQGAPHTRTGMPIALAVSMAVSHTTHEHAPPRTRRGTRRHMADEMAMADE